MAASCRLSACPRRKSSLAFSMLPKSLSNIAHDRCTYLDRGLTSSPCLNRYLTALLSPYTNRLLSLCCHAASTAAVLCHVGSERSRASRCAVLCCHAALRSSFAEHLPGTNKVPYTFGLSPCDVAWCGLGSYCVIGTDQLADECVASRTFSQSGLSR